jgi:preprotein translocase subunit SecA
MALGSLYHRVRGSALAARLLRQARRALAQLPEMAALPDAVLAERFHALRPALAGTRGASAARSAAMALCAEAVRRQTGITLHPEQVAAALALLRGSVAEMKTGEGKTLAIVPAAAVHALLGRQVHVATANAYLAQRDAQALAAVYETLRLRAAVTLPGQTLEQKRSAYAAHVIYGPGSEFAFDWMRNMLAMSPTEQVDVRFDAAIVDEADAVLIDDARTPMVVSRSAEGDPSVYTRVWQCVRDMREGVHFDVDRTRRQASFREAGFAELERATRAAHLLDEAGSLYAPANLAVARLALAALQVLAFYERDKDYIVAGGQVLIVSPSTGRVMAGRRWQDGIHELIEAREGLDVHMPTEVTASISVQRYFGRYRWLSGLTGTALTEAEELAELYGLPVVVVPPHRPVQRLDREDIVYATAREKIAALAERAGRESAAGRPVLIGTASVEESEAVSAELRRHGIAHTVLNARQNEEEALKIAAAGAPGAVTVSTNMAGRGTDIRLGRSAQEREQVVRLGGLLVLGASRTDSERSALQLRGRAGRQGDPGESQFYLSLEDELLRDFGGDHLARAFRLLGGAAGRPLSHPRISALVRAAQARMARRAYEGRLHAAQLDGVVDTVRQAYYGMRQAIVVDDAAADGVRALAVAAATSHLLGLFAELPPNATALQVKQAVRAGLGIEAPVVRMLEQDGLRLTDVARRCAADAARAAFGAGAKLRLLRTLDEHFIGLMSQVEGLKDGASLVAFAARSPQVAFMQSVASAFDDFLQTALVAFVRYAAQAAKAESSPPQPAQAPAGRVLEQMRHRFVERNEPCPCGSAARFRQCHGRVGMVGFLQYD